MENYKPNSFKSREVNVNDKSNKKLNKVVTGKVVTKKKNGFEKIAGSIFSENIGNVGDFILQDVLIPSVKKAISDIFRNGIDIFLYGQQGRPRDSKLPGSRVSYSGMYNSSANDRRNLTPIRRDLDYDDIVLENAGDAQIILTQMEDTIARYGFVTVADLYDALGKDTHNHCLNKYGWTNLSNAGYRRVRDGYLLELPKAMPID